MKPGIGTERVYDQRVRIMPAWVLGLIVVAIILALALFLIRHRSN